MPPARNIIKAIELSFQGRGQNIDFRQVISDGAYLVVLVAELQAEEVKSQIMWLGKPISYVIL